MKAVDFMEEALLRVFIPLKVDETQSLSDAQNRTRKPGT
jgi:hypothetical protein